MCVYVSTYTPAIHPAAGDEEEAPSGSRAFMCAHFVLSGREWETKGIGGMRSLDTEPTSLDVAESKIWRRGIIQRVQKEFKSLRNVSALLCATCRVMLK